LCYPNVIKWASPDAVPGSLVSVFDPSGKKFGVGLYNPNARIPLRMFHHGEDTFTEDDFFVLLGDSISLRKNVLKLDKVSNVYRIVNSDGDGLSGLIVDKFSDVLSISVHCRGVWQRLSSWIGYLTDKLGTKSVVVQVDPEIAEMEGMNMENGGIQKETNHTIKTSRLRRKAYWGGDDVQTTQVTEGKVNYEINFDYGHKTGFFCDQRENRFRLSALAQGATSMLDLCCYNGAFSLSAVIAGVKHATAVDIDPYAIAQARRNVVLNGIRGTINFVHGDAFSFTRDQVKAKKKWQVVVLDPPKFVAESYNLTLESGKQKYADLNELALTLVEQGGLFVTCSCSGSLSTSEFQHIVGKASVRAGRRLQLLPRQERLLTTLCQQHAQKATTLKSYGGVYFSTLYITT